ncbi:MAG: hypothetical protein IKT08_00550 [Bacteroidales bacterium]|nr:hypothetical protein [Bacteroidales bacterium]
MRDFTLKAYRSLLEAFLQAGYRFLTFEEFLEHPEECKAIVMRHDVDELAWNALKMAQLEHGLGVRATYYFRIVKQSNVPEVIRQVVELGHEVGYHYEDLALAEGDEEKAMASFEKNLAYFRTYYPVRTVCMHGSSTSKYDNRLLWKSHWLPDYGLIGEPYLSVDFNKVYYLTDTGYAWDGEKIAVRDVVKTGFDLSFHTTKQIVDCVGRGQFPDQALILAHTLWTDRPFQWYWLHVREYIRNNIKHFARNNKTVAVVYEKAVNWYWKKKH